MDYGVSSIPVSEFIISDAHIWDIPKVTDFFHEEDARLILATRIPLGAVSDRIAWPRASDGNYSVKTGYQHWCENNLHSATIRQVNGWSKLWRLNVPHKVKVFLWRFCRNNIPVRNKLRTKGVHNPITCPHVYFRHRTLTTCLF